MPITFRPTKIESTRNKILKLLNKSGLNQYELIYLCGQIGYDVGQSCYPEKNLTVQDIEEKFQEGRPNPPVSLAMMAQSRQVVGWIETILEAGKSEEK